MRPGLEQRVRLEMIVRDSERLLKHAKESESRYLTYLVQNVLYEADAMLRGDGHEMPPDDTPIPNTVVELFRRK